MSKHYDLPEPPRRESDGTSVAFVLSLVLLVILLACAGFFCFVLVQLALWIAS